MRGRGVYRPCAVAGLHYRRAIELATELDVVALAANGVRAASGQYARARDVGNAHSVAPVVECHARIELQCGLRQTVVVVEVERRVVGGALRQARHERSLKLAPVALEVVADTCCVDVERSGTCQFAAVVATRVGIERAGCALGHLKRSIVGGVRAFAVGVVKRSAAELYDRRQLCLVAALNSIDHSGNDDEAAHLVGRAERERSGTVFAEHSRRPCAANAALHGERRRRLDVDDCTALAYENLLARGH